jgi:hypothetical protein
MVIILATAQNYEMGSVVIAYFLNISIEEVLLSAQ